MRDTDKTEPCQLWRYWLAELAQAERQRNLSHNTDYRFIQIAERYIAPTVPDDDMTAYNAEVNHLASILRAEFQRNGSSPRPTIQ